jgi:glycosyltransferase involved in cell wall biosynthesis
MLTTAVVSNPAVSVIIPVFNGERFLAEALASIWAQDYAPLDVLIIDDGSTDASAEVAAGVCRERAEPRLLRQHARGGPAAARNAGLGQAGGELITFLDADDLMTPGRLHFQVDYLASHPEADVVVGTETIQVSPGIELPEWLGWHRDGRPRYCQMSMMVRRAIFDGVGLFDESFRLSSDIEWRYRADTGGVRTALVDRVLLVRRIHGGNLTYATAEMRHAMRRALLKSARDRIRRSGNAS